MRTLLPFILIGLLGPLSGCGSPDGATQDNSGLNGQGNPNPNPPAPPLKVAPSGNWAQQDRAQMTVTDKGATIQFPCAGGQIGEPMVVDDKGHFDMAGTFESGPVARDPAPDARYVGSTDGKTMNLQIIVNGKTAATADLTFGLQTFFVRCL